MRWLIALFFLTGIVFAQTLQPPNIQESPSAQTNPSAEQPDANQPTPIINPIAAPQSHEKAAAHDTERDKERFDGWTLSDKIAGIASAVAFLQFIALILTVSVMRWAARRQLRAYIFLDPAKEFTFVRRPSTTATMEVEIHVKNLGATPAHDVIGESWVTLDVWPMPADFSFTGPLDDGPRSPDVIPPGGRSHFHTGSSRPLTAEEFAAVQSGALRVYIYGAIRYKDAFDRHHWTNFCQASTALGREGFTTAMAKCDRHNDADRK